jgi:hypothetical protein
MHKPENNKWPDNFQQLIRETDGPFEAVGITPVPNNDAATIAIRRISPSAGLCRQYQAHVARKLSVSAPKHNNTVNYKKPLVTEPTPKIPNVTPSPNQQCTLTEMTDGLPDIFASNVFSRISVDEILTPARIHQLGICSTETKLQISSETASSSYIEEIWTPIGPFHLEDLTSRIRAAGVFPGSGSNYIRVQVQHHLPSQKSHPRPM